MAFGAIPSFTPELLRRGGAAERDPDDEARRYAKRGSRRERKRAKAALKREQRLTEEKRAEERAAKTRRRGIRMPTMAEMMMNFAPMFGREEVLQLREEVLQLVENDMREASQSIDAMVRDLVGQSTEYIRDPDNNVNWRVLSLYGLQEITRQQRRSMLKDEFYGGGLYSVGPRDEPLSLVLLLTGPSDDRGRIPPGSYVQLTWPAGDSGARTELAQLEGTRGRVMNTQLEGDGNSLPRVRMELALLEPASPDAIASARAPAAAVVDVIVSPDGTYGQRYLAVPEAVPENMNVTIAKAVRDVIGPDEFSALFNGSWDMASAKPSFAELSLEEQNARLRAQVEQLQGELSAARQRLMERSMIRAMRPVLVDSAWVDPGEVRAVVRELAIERRAQRRMALGEEL